MAKVLSPKALRWLQDTFDQAAAELVSELLERGEVDGVADLVEVFPTVVFPNIARIEAEAVLTALAEQVASIDLIDEPRPRLNNSLRGLDTLPLRLQPA